MTLESTKTNIRLLDETERSGEPVLSPATSSGLKSPPITKMMKKKKSGNSLVRKLSLNKFRFGSSDQETRYTPEGDESSRSPSQSSQESPGNNDSPIRNLQKVNQHQREQQLNEKLVNTKEKKSREKKVTTPVVTSTLDRRNPTSTWGHDKEKGAATTMSERRIDEQHRQRQQKQLEKTPSTVTVIQRKSPSVTIKTSFTGNNKGSLELKRDDSSGTLGTVSTLPYALSKWPEKNFDTKTSVQFKKTKLSVKSESESSLTRNLSVKTSPVEVRRKLSLLDEKRAIFQRKYFKSSEEEEDLSRDTVIHAATESLDKFVELTDGKKTKNNSSDLKSSRPISVKTFDTFDEQSLDYLDDIDERFSSLEIQNDVFSTTNTKRDSIAVMGETSEVPRRLSADSGSTHNSAPITGAGEKREHLYKILVIGELGAGKTSIIKRYVHQFFSQNYRATIGVDFALKVLNWDPQTIIRLQLWDIAGQERFGNMTRVYYKEAVGAFIVFDVTRSATLDAVVKWKQDLETKVQLPDGSPIPCVLLANKCDQTKEGLINSPGKMDDYCKEKNFAGWFETSAKENINIEEAARFLVNKILQNDQVFRGNGAQDQTDGERFALNQSPKHSKNSCSC
ncbi:hypothetical protein PV328_005072 [Microctonus aethiopoides]|uniref:Ras-related protein Rab-32 n=1 Tax=Microctonus aethiopoides TaxID=144406 RepID=A0AA39FL63_9HYME|nr:hypothetical protein PV328_005072 [Microctonus aethiopoides]